MDAANTTDAFAERIRAMTAQLRDQLAHDSSDGSTEDSPAAGEMLDELYRQGAELGLTNKEIVRQLIAPVAEFLRPGLTR